MIESLAKIAFVALGGAIGAVARYLINLSAIGRLAGYFPAHTFLINILGSFVFGFAFVVFERKFQADTNLRLFVFTGFLGAFTTFSALEFELWELLERGRFPLALVYLLLSVFFGFLGLVLGMQIARKLF